MAAEKYPLLFSDFFTTEGLYFFLCMMRSLCLDQDFSLQLRKDIWLHLHVSNLKITALSRSEHRTHPVSMRTKDFLAHFSQLAPNRINQPLILG